MPSGVLVVGSGYMTHGLPFLRDWRPPVLGQAGGTSGEVFVSMHRAFPASYTSHRRSSPDGTAPERPGLHAPFLRMALGFASTGEQQVFRRQLDPTGPPPEDLTARMPSARSTTPLSPAVALASCCPMAPSSAKA